MAITRREKHIIRVIKFYEPPSNTIEEDLLNSGFVTWRDESYYLSVTVSTDSEYNLIRLLHEDNIRFVWKR